MMAARVYRHGRVPQWSSAASWSALSLLPDVDVVGFALGVEYRDPWGHRGATHSLTLSVALGFAIGLAARWFRRPVLRTALTASAVLASHGLLDTMTDGGLGCALLWPFDLTRYFAPWRPIPVAPIGMDFFSLYGGFVALTEVVLFSPVLLLAWRSRRIDTKPAALFLAAWLLCVWFISSGDPIRDAIVGYFVREDTTYASGFTEKAFRVITPGESENEVGAGYEGRHPSRGNLSVFIIRGSEIPASYREVGGVTRGRVPVRSFREWRRCEGGGSRRLQADRC